MGEEDAGPGRKIGCLLQGDENPGCQALGLGLPGSRMQPLLGGRMIKDPDGLRRLAYRVGRETL